MKSRFLIYSLPGTVRFRLDRFILGIKKQAGFIQARRIGRPVSNTGPSIQRRPPSCEAHKYYPYQRCRDQGDQIVSGEGVAMLPAAQVLQTHPIRKIRTLLLSTTLLPVVEDKVEDAAAQTPEAASHNHSRDLSNLELTITRMAPSPATLPCHLEPLYLLF